MARFVRASRGILGATPFLDRKWDRTGLPAVEIAWSALPAPRERPRLSFIWHTSFCCSTLIAELLERPGRCLALKEPRALVDLADLKRRGDLARAPELVSRVLGLMARRFAPEEQVLIKPSNGANLLVLPAAAQADGPILLLHSPCADFVVSTAKAGESMRAFVRALLLTLLADQPQAGRISPADLARMTDLQAAALAWQLQMAALERAAKALGPRCRTLDSAVFRERPQAALDALAAFFGVEPDLGRAARALSRDAKSGKLFDREGRAARAQAAVSELGVDLDQLIAWSFRAAGWAEPGAVLPQPLLA